MADSSGTDIKPCSADFFGGGRSPTAVFADTIEHTHIWATTYDSTNHWEYCTVCGEKRNVTAHVFTDHWKLGHEGCGYNNYSTRTCACGYSYTYHKPHSTTTRISSSTYYERVHATICNSCGDWLKTEACKNANGVINCKNPGKCLTCGGTWPAGRHFINNGTCSACGKTFYKLSEPQVSYNNDFTHVYIKYIFYPVNSSVIPIDTQTNYSPYTNGGMSHHGNVVKNSDGTYTINLDVTISSQNEKTSVGWMYNNVAVNGVTCFVYTSAITVWQDHQAPVQNDVIQKDQASANGWATIKQLTLSGTETLSDIVYLTVSDKATGEKYVTNAAVSVADGKYSYTCTPSIEGDANGRTYVVTVKDRIGNTSTKEFVVSKTDGSAPALKSGTSLSYTDWSTSKNISLSFYDFGSGGVQASLDNQTDYKLLTKSGEYYVWTHKFGNHVGTTAHKLYVKDALGNATVYTLTEGNTDSNVYSISYNLNGGALSGQKTNYTVADSFTLPQPTNTGYTFIGWTGTGLSSYTKSVTITKGSSGNKNYTANWIPNGYIITFNYNRPNNSSCEIMSGNNTANKGVSYNAGYGVLPTPALQGWNFAGWFTAASGGSQVIDATKYAIVGNQTLYAHWTPITWTVKYDANGGSGTMVDTKHTYMVVVKLNKNTFFRNGYTFNGWTASRTRDGKAEWLCGNTDGSWISGNEWYKEGNIPSNRKIYRFADCQIMFRSTYTNGDVITAHAQWTTNTYTNILKHWAYGMKYSEGNNGDKNYFLIGDTPYTKSYGEIYVMDDSWLIKIPNGYYPTRSTGFFTFASDGTMNGFITRGFGYKFIQNDNYSYENLYHELYYSPYEYSITYNLNGGTNNNANPSTYNVLYGVTLKNPTRTGYTFTGWYDENGNKITGINEGCNATFSSADDLYAKLAKRTTGNRTLTAHWSYNPVSIKVPQVLTGDHTGKSQFRVKCDDFKTGSIKVAIPNSFLYKQAGKADVAATITAKSGNNTITPSNKVCVYNITTTNGLSAGCWQGSFNIGLTLIKE